MVVIVRFMLGVLIMTTMMLPPAQGGPVAYATCQAGCALIATACFAAAGFTWGTVPGAVIAAVPALAACNTALATCYAMCSTFLIAPIP